MAAGVVARDQRTPVIRRSRGRLCKVAQPPRGGRVRCAALFVDRGGGEAK